MLEKPLNLKRGEDDGYYSLTEITAVQYAKDHGYFEAKANVVCHEIGDGNLNYVFKLDDGEKSIIIKRTAYAKVVGESWPLSIKRATIESKALQIFAQYVYRIMCQQCTVMMKS